MPEFYAHTRENDANTAHWQKLECHLQNVAHLASQFTTAFSSRDWGHIAGLWHDLGKYQPEFQERLQGKQIAVEHSGSGAGLAVQKDKAYGKLLAFVIAGHHTGLANAIESGPGFPSPLLERLKNHDETALSQFLDNAPASITECSLPSLPPFLKQISDSPTQSKESLMRSLEFWIRFLFSALVDADRLDTEAFDSPQQTALRGIFSPLPTLRKDLDHFIDDKVSTLTESESNTPINRARTRILSACRTTATCPPGTFSLTVPTGGGKTLSAMSFALRHAEHNNLNRVLVVIPYTSIIEQNAAVYRQALGTENVVEHHSNLDVEKAKRERGLETTYRHDLASENWDAPVVVTTTVQFFESLFSNKTSRCRKLHNIARSVIILDEVQSLPLQFLRSILDALNELVSHYGCSIVLSTATPPALAARERFEFGLKNIREIIDDPSVLSADLKRVRYHWPSPEESPDEWPALAKQLTEHEQVLTVVHKRKDARELAEELQVIAPEEALFHLSALMCPAHRSDILQRVKNELSHKKTCRLISTQLIEAGVDIDFPVVYRALGGLDSIVQAAGRCNREGTLTEGQVFVFNAPTSPPPGTPRRALEVTASLLQEYDNALDPSDPSLFEQYFRMLYMLENQDAHGIQTLRQELNFATVGQKFRLIEDGFTHSVVVPYGEAQIHLDTLDSYPQGLNRQTLRNLQPYLVSIYPRSFDKLLQAGAIIPIAEGVDIYKLSTLHTDLYDETFGLTEGDIPHADPEKLII